MGRTRGCTSLWSVLLKARSANSVWRSYTAFHLRSLPPAAQQPRPAPSVNRARRLAPLRHYRHCKVCDKALVTLVLSRMTSSGRCAVAAFSVLLSPSDRKCGVIAPFAVSGFGKSGTRLVTALSVFCLQILCVGSIAAKALITCCRLAATAGPRVPRSARTWFVSISMALVENHLVNSSALVLWLKHLPSVTFIQHARFDLKPNFTTVCR